MSLRKLTAINVSLASFPEIYWDRNPSMFTVRTPLETCKSFGLRLVPGIVHEEALLSVPLQTKVKLSPAQNSVLLVTLPFNSICAPTQERENKLLK